MARRLIGPRPAPRRRRSAGREAGFTLIEVIVAFVLLSVVLMTSFEMFTGGMRRAGDLEDYSRALVIAQSKIAAVGTEEAYKEGETQGDSDDGRYHWVLSVHRTDEGAPQPGQPVNNPYALFRVEVRVGWRSADTRERSIALATLGLGSAI